MAYLRSQIATLEAVISAIILSSSILALSYLGYAQIVPGEIQSKLNFYNMVYDMSNIIYNHKANCISDWNYSCMTNATKALSKAYHIEYLKISYNKNSTSFGDKEVCYSINYYCLYYQENKQSAYGDICFSGC